VGMLCKLIDEAVQALRDDGAVNQFINHPSINIALIVSEISIDVDVMIIRDEMFV